MDKIKLTPYQKWQLKTPTRELAIKHGAMRYKSLVPCKRGHTWFRWTDTDMCLICLNLKNRRRANETIVT